MHFQDAARNLIRKPRCNRYEEQVEPHTYKDEGKKLRGDGGEHSLRSGLVNLRVGQRSEPSCWGNGTLRAQRCANIFWGALGAQRRCAGVAC